MSESFELTPEKAPEAEPWTSVKGLPIPSVRKLAGFLMAYRVENGVPTEPIMGKIGMAWGAEMLNWCDVEEGTKVKREVKKKRKSEQESGKSASKEHLSASSLVSFYRSRYEVLFGSPAPQTSYGWDIKQLRTLLEGGYAEGKLQNLIDEWLMCGQDMQTYPKGQIYGRGTIRDFTLNLGKLEAWLLSQKPIDKRPVVPYGLEDNA